jgi:uncharacterized protein
LLSDSLAYSDDDSEPLPKIVLKAHGKSGFDVVNLIKNMDPSDETLTNSGGIVHMAGSIIALPGSCFLWNVRTPEELTVESLALVQLYRPTLEYLFIGSNKPVSPQTILKLKQALGSEVAGKGGIVVEQMDITNTMGTFNILNGEDRLVAAAFILEPEPDE